MVQISIMLPRPLREALMRAAGIERPAVPWGESTRRAEALQEIIDRIKKHNPQFFRQGD
jgi:hypothetical protein